MKPITIGKGILWGAIFLGSLFLLGLIIYKLAALFAYFFIAIIVTLLGLPMVRFLRDKAHFPRSLSVLSYLLLVLSIIVGSIALLVPRLAAEGKTLLQIETIKNKINRLYGKLRESGETGEAVGKVMEEGNLEENVIKNMEENIMPDVIGTFFEVLGEIGFGLFSVLFISFFFLHQGNFIQRKLLIQIHPRYRIKALAAMDESKDLLSRYLLGLLAQMAIIFVFYASGMYLGAVENALLIAFVAALFNIIPYLGPIFGGGLMLALSLSANLDQPEVPIWPALGFVLGGFLIGQLVDNLFSQPFILGSSTKSHPLEIFVIIIASGLLFGIIGMIIAVPSYTIIKVVLREFLDDTPLWRKFSKPQN